MGTKPYSITGGGAFSRKNIYGANRTNRQNTNGLRLTITTNWLHSYIRNWLKTYLMLAVSRINIISIPLKADRILRANA